MKLNTTPLCVQNTALHPFGLLLCIYLKHTKTSLECSRCVQSTIVQSNSAWLVSLQSSKFVLWKWPLQHSLTVLGCYKRNTVLLSHSCSYTDCFFCRGLVYFWQEKTDNDLHCFTGASLSTQALSRHWVSMYLHWRLQCSCGSWHKSTGCREHRAGAGMRQTQR